MKRTKAKPRLVLHKAIEKPAQPAPWSPPELNDDGGQVPPPSRSIARGVYVSHSMDAGSREFRVFDSRERLILRVGIAAEFATKAFLQRLEDFLNDVDYVPPLTIEKGKR